VLNLRRARKLIGSVLVAASLTAACAGDGDDPGGGPALADEAAGIAILDQLLASPDQGSGTVRFAFRSTFRGTTTMSVQGVADHDQQRYVSRLELLEHPEAAYDVAVIAGFRYEKLLSVKTPGAPDRKPQLSSAERWSPVGASMSVPYVPLPFVGEAGRDMRWELDGFNAGRRRDVADVTIVGFTRIGVDKQRGSPTVQYRLTFSRDGAKVALAPELASGLLSIGPEQPSSREVDVWIDHTGRLRRYVLPLAAGTTLDFEFWDYGAPPAVVVPSDLKLRPDGVPDERQRQLAERSLLGASDLPGYAPASATTVEAATYARCWDGTGLLGGTSTDRTATALSPVYRKGTTYVATSVVLARTPAASSAAYQRFEDTAMLSCVSAMFKGAVVSETGQVALIEQSEIVREPVLADQSIAYRLDLGIARPGRREPESHRHLQLTVLRVGRGLAMVFSASVGSPFPEEERRRMARLVAGRFPT
jgi:hypothetical protein